MAALVAAVLLLLAAGGTVVLGVGWLAIIPLLLAIAAFVWGGITIASGRTPARAVRQTDSPELLGPGGPDDPDR
jgi:hypothetical protein